MSRNSTYVFAPSELEEVAAAARSLDDIYIEGAGDMALVVEDPEGVDAYVIHKTGAGVHVEFV